MVHNYLEIEIVVTALTLARCECAVDAFKAPIAG
jgi:hypothetical protein